MGAGSRTTFGSSGCASGVGAPVWPRGVWVGAEPDGALSHATDAIMSRPAMTETVVDSLTIISSSRR